MGVSALSTTGCDTTGKHVRWYDGSPRMANEVVILKVQRDPQPVLIDKIDDVPFLKGKIFHNYNTTEIEFLPGAHTIEVRYFDAAGRRSTANIKLDLSCELGHEYELHSAPCDESFGKLLKQMTIGGTGQWTAWEFAMPKAREVVAGSARKEPYRWFEK